MEMDIKWWWWCNHHFPFLLLIFTPSKNTTLPSFSRIGPKVEDWLFCQYELNFHTGDYETYQIPVYLVYIFNFLNNNTFSLLLSSLLLLSIFYCTIIKIYDYAFLYSFSYLQLSYKSLVKQWCNFCLSIYLLLFCLQAFYLTSCKTMGFF